METLPDIPKVKVLLLGDASVGKTAVIHQFVNREFQSAYRPTIGTDFMCRQVDVNGTFITLQIWDTAGQERYRSLSTSYYRDTEICVFVYDITSPSTFSSIPGWHSIFERKCGPLPSNFPLLLLGNKLDEVSKRAVPIEAAKQFAEDHGILFYEVSAKSCDNVAEAMDAVVHKFMENARVFEEKAVEGIVMDTEVPQEKSYCPC
jgi:Ras-related protein Rab-7A